MYSFHSYSPGHPDLPLPERLKSRGVNISDKGVSVKTTSRFNREDYLDATQRGVIKAMSAASFGPGENPEDKVPVISRTNSSTGSLHSNSGSLEDPSKKSKRGFISRKISSGR